MSWLPRSLTIWLPPAAAAACHAATPPPLAACRLPPSAAPAGTCGRAADTPTPLSAMAIPLIPMIPPAPGNLGASLGMGAARQQKAAEAAHPCLHLSSSNAAPAAMQHPPLDASGPPDPAPREAAPPRAAPGGTCLLRTGRVPRLQTISTPRAAGHSHGRLPLLVGGGRGRPAEAAGGPPAAGRQVPRRQGARAGQLGGCVSAGGAWEEGRAARLLFAHNSLRCLAAAPRQPLMCVCGAAPGH